MDSKLFFTLLLIFGFHTFFSQTYQDHLEQSNKQRIAFKNSYESTTNKDSMLSIAGKFIEQELTERQYNFWKGTPWDYNGYSNTPKKGKIACGYYVSTNLKHLGVNINRYRMAQQSAMNEVKTIDSLPKIVNGTSIDFITYCHKHLADGLYILGMTNHVGLLQKKGTKVWLLHSSPVDITGVIKEDVSRCEVLTWSDIFVIGKLSTNKTFIKKWLYQIEIKVVLD